MKSNPTVNYFVPWAKVRLWRQDFNFSLITFLSCDDEIDNANSEQPLSIAPHYVWQYFAKQSVTSAVIVSKSGSNGQNNSIILL